MCCRGFLSRDKVEGKETYLSTLFNHLEPQNGGLHVSADQPQQEVSQCLSAPPSLQPFFKDQESAPSGKNTLSPSSQIVSNLQMTWIIFQGDSYRPVTLETDFVITLENPNFICLSLPPLVSSRTCAPVWMSCLVLCLQLPLRQLPHRLITKYDALHVCKMNAHYPKCVIFTTLGGVSCYVNFKG